MKFATILRLSVSIIMMKALEFCYSIPLEGKVIGGQVVQPGVIRCVVSYRHNKRHKCTGFLFSPNTVLIAAHCINEFLIDEIIPDFDEYSVMAGIIDNFYSAEPYAIKQLVTHRKYQFENTKPNHNIGIIELMKEIDISGYARYCFGANYSPYVTQMGYTMAWGFHRETAFSVESIVLKNITVEVKAKHVCDLKSKGNLICASVVTPNDIFMPEDMGAPLTDDLLVTGILVAILPDNKTALYVGIFQAEKEILQIKERLSNRVTFTTPRTRVTYEQFEYQKEEIMAKLRCSTVLL